MEQRKQEAALNYDGGKVQLELIPWDAVHMVARVMTQNVGKYPARNWEKGMSWSRHVGSAFRHLIAHMMGETIDPESKLPHLAMFATRALMLLTSQIRGIGTDDTQTCVPAIKSSYWAAFSEDLKKIEAVPHTITLTPPVGNEPAVITLKPTDEAKLSEAFAETLKANGVEPKSAAQTHVEALTEALDAGKPVWSSADRCFRLHSDGEIYIMSSSWLRLGKVGRSTVIQDFVDGPNCYTLERPGH